MRHGFKFGKPFRKRMDSMITELYRNIRIPFHVESHKSCFICRKNAFRMERCPNGRCMCSWCTDLHFAGTGSFGFRSPIDKSSNSWRTLYWVRKSRILYVRWTGFWQ
jgi:hypothetical protein